MSAVDQFYNNFREQKEKPISEYDKIVFNSETEQILRDKDGEEHEYGFGGLQVEIDDSMGRKEVRLE